jgi:hypothetical protein
VQQLPTGLPTLAGPHWSQLQSGPRGSGDPRFEIRAFRRPGDEARPRKIVQAKPPRAGRRRLCGVGPDELQVHGRTEPDECVPRALPRVRTARGRTHAEERLEACDLLVEVQSTPDEVIDRR